MTSQTSPNSSTRSTFFSFFFQISNADLIVCVCVCVCVRVCVCVWKSTANLPKTICELLKKYFLLYSYRQNPRYFLVQGPFKQNLSVGDSVASGFLSTTSWTWVPVSASQETSWCKTKLTNKKAHFCHVLLLELKVKLCRNTFCPSFPRAVTSWASKGFRPCTASQNRIAIGGSHRSKEFGQGSRALCWIFEFIVRTLLNTRVHRMNFADEIFEFIVWTLLKYTSS